MKKLLLILLCLPMIGFGQLTIIPDVNFEQALIYLGYDTGIVNGSVPTANIDTVSWLMLGPPMPTISDLTGIEDFSALEELACHNQQLTFLDLSANTSLITLNCNENQLTSLDLSNNTLLTTLWCNENQLTSLDIRNGNNTNMNGLSTYLNPNLTCINVDDPSINWQNLSNSFFFEPQNYFSTNCLPTSIQKHTKNKEILKSIDLLGREKKQSNQPLFYIYDDGTVEKRIRINYR